MKAGEQIELAILGLDRRRQTTDQKVIESSRVLRTTVRTTMVTATCCDANIDATQRRDAPHM